MFYWMMERIQANIIKFWRVEAYSDSTGVCVTNAAKGTNGLNAKYVLLPVTENTN